MISYRFWNRTLRKYRNVQARIARATSEAVVQRLSRKQNLLERRIIRLNRQWKLGIATAALLAWMSSPAQAQFDNLVTGNSLDGTTGLIITGSESYEYSGSSLSAAGDFNGDGFDDVIVGGYYTNYAQGRVHLVFGGQANNPDEIDAAGLDNATGFTVEGTDTSTYFGFSLGSAGDVNGDGFDDVIIGAPLEQGGAGAAYVIFGTGDDLNGQFSLSSLDGSNGFRVVNSDASQNYLGVGVNGVGDVDGDGFDDIAIATFDSAYYGGSGRIYVLFGKQSGFSDQLDVSQADTSELLVIQGDPSISRLGIGGAAKTIDGADLNDDGFDDVIIGAGAASVTPNDSVGRVFVVYGTDQGFNAQFSLTDIDGNNGVAINGTSTNSYTGSALSSAGDFNGDGVEDIIIGAKYAEVDTATNAGQAYIIFGNANGITHPFDLSSVDGANGTVFNGRRNYSEIAYSVSGAGDINGDGFDDVIIGTPYAFFFNGGAFVVFGFDDQGRSQFDVFNVNGDNGFLFQDTATYGSIGYGVSGAGDFNGDGFDDVITSNQYGGVMGRQEAGITYMIFGRDSTIIGVEDEVADMRTASMQLYPNPVHNQLMLASPLLENGPDPVDVIIYDASGRRYTTPWQRNGQALQLDVSGLENGIYLLHLSSEGESAHRYFIKQ